MSAIRMPPNRGHCQRSEEGTILLQDAAMRGGAILVSVYETIAERIRYFRERTKMSQEDVAKKIGVAPNTISRWETTTYRPTLDDLENLSRALRISILELLPEETSPSDKSASALLRSAKALDKNDLQELRRYADYLRARSALKEMKTPKRRNKAN